MNSKNHFTQDTASQIQGSSPIGSLIQIDRINRPKLVDLEDQDAITGDLNLDLDSYSDRQYETIINKNSKFTFTNSNSMEMTENRGAINLDFEEEDTNDSALFEVSQSEFLNSQKQRDLPSQELISSPIQVLSLPRSGQSPKALPETVTDIYRDDSPSQNLKISSSSSPLITQHTQPSMAPSAQLTSFRMQSPIKIRTTPKKSDLLVTQASFTVPNLISSNPSTPNTIHSSPSIYCTAKQSSPPFEYKRSNVPFIGRVTTKKSSPFNNVQTRVLAKRTIRSIEEEDDRTKIENEVNGSGSSEDEDDSNLSIIEVTRTVKKSKPSVLQVVSSPGFDKFSSPYTSPIKTKNNVNENNEYNESNKENIINDEFETMSMDEIKKKIIQYGLKPARSKLKMVESLREITSYLSQDSIIKLSQSQNVNKSKNLIKSEIFNKIDNILSNDLKIIEKITTFEPIKLIDLENALKKDNINLNTEMLKEWCDRNSICLIEE